MKRIIYLVGQISSDKRSYNWRENIESYVEKLPNNIRKDIEILNPCNNGMNQDLIKNATNDEKSYNGLAFIEPSLNLLGPLDAGYVHYSNMCIANMNHFTPERPILGSYFELAWYYKSYPYKPVIGIFNGDPESDYQCRHPFVKAAIHAWVKNEIEAIQLVLKQCFHM